MWLLDTCVISEMRKASSGTADQRVMRWAGSHAIHQLYLSAITVKELVYGVLLVERRDPVQGRRLRAWLEPALAEFAGRILAVDERVARQAAELHLPDPTPEADAYIGATALTHDLCVVTRNVRDFARFGALRLENPWGDDS